MHDADEALDVDGLGDASRAVNDLDGALADDLPLGDGNLPNGFAKGFLGRLGWLMELLARDARWLAGCPS
jgi:hypothetical protein